MTYALADIPAVTLHEKTVYLRKAFRKAGITARQAGALVGRSRETFLKYLTEQDGRIIPDDLLEKLDDALCAGEHLKFKPKLHFVDEGDR